MAKETCDHIKVLEATLDMLQYSHTTSESYYDYKKVSEFIERVNDYLKENK